MEICVSVEKANFTRNCAAQTEIAKREENVVK